MFDLTKGSNPIDYAMVRTVNQTYSIEIRIAVDSMV